MKTQMKARQFHRIKKLFESLTVPKNEKEGALWAFLSPSWVQKIRIAKEGTLWRHQEIIETKVTQKAQTKIKTQILGFQTN